MSVDGIEFFRILWDARKSDVMAKESRLVLPSEQTLSVYRVVTIVFQGDG